MVKKRSVKVYGQSGYKYRETPTIMLKGMWLKEKDNGLPLFITSAACMSRSMSGMGSELIGGTLKPKYHSDSAGRRGVMWNRKQNRIIKIRKTTLPSSAVLRL